MAKPDTDDGWFKLSHELDAAMAVADFRKGERVVLREVFAQIYGKAKRKTATLSPKAISELSGMSPANVSHAVTGLVSGGVLRRTNDGTYLFFKDYETWTYKESSRLSRQEITYAKRATKTVLSYCDTTTVKILSNETTDKPLDIVQIDNPTTTVSVSLNNKSLSNETIRFSAPPDPLHGNAHAELETRETAAATASDAGEPLPFEKWIVNGETPMGHPVMSPEHGETIRVARDEFGNPFGEEIAEMGARIHGALGGKWEFYIAAIKHTKRSGKAITYLYSYCLTKAQGYRKEGIPREPIGTPGTKGANGTHRSTSYQKTIDSIPDDFEKSC